MYKLTFFMNTGLIQVQGNNKDHFATNVFPKLKSLVTDIIKHNIPSASAPITSREAQTNEKILAVQTNTV